MGSGPPYRHVLAWANSAKFCSAGLCCTAVSVPLLSEQVNLFGILPLDWSHLLDKQENSLGLDWAALVSPDPNSNQMATL